MPASESENKSMTPSAPLMEREHLVRMTTEVRQEDEGRTLVGYAAVFNEFTEINSWEGRFKEKIQNGAFKRTLGRGGQRDQIKVLFNHGMDPSIGDKPLGKPRTMKEDSRGLFVEVPLDDTSYNRDIIASLKSGALDGMSFRMSVIRDEWDKLDTELPERTIQEIRLYEFGPVTFPAYKATEAGVRAHAPEAFMAFRSQQRERAANVVYTPSQWRGWSIVNTGTASNGVDVTYYVRDEDVPATPEPIEETTSALVAGGMTPEEAVEHVNREDDVQANDEDVITRVESESDTLTRQDDSVDNPSSEDPPSDDSVEDPSTDTLTDAPVEDPAPDEDDPSTAPSSETPKRHSLTRKAITLDEMHERLVARKKRTERYLQINPTE